METAERAETLFHELDANPDGGITEEEFIRFLNPFLENYNFLEPQSLSDLKFNF